MLKFETKFIVQVCFKCSHALHFLLSLPIKKICCFSKKVSINKSINLNKWMHSRAKRAIMQTTTKKRQILVSWHLKFSRSMLRARCNSITSQCTSSINIRHWWDVSCDVLAAMASPSEHLLMDRMALNSPLIRPTLVWHFIKVNQHSSPSLLTHWLAGPTSNDEWRKEGSKLASHSICLLINTIILYAHTSSGESM